MFASWLAPSVAALLAAVVAFDRERAPAPHVVSSRSGIDVYRSGDMAMAWVSYGVRFGTHEALKEWTGVDAITLIRHEDRWRITSIAWSGD